MATNEKEIELAWIKEVLEKRGENMMNVFAKAINEQKLVKTSSLLGSLGYSAEGSDSADAVLKLIFNTYGRFQDLGAPKKPSARKREEDLPLLGQPRKKGKPRRWYMRNLYGELDRMIYELIYGLDQGTKEILREQLTQLNTTKNGSN